MSKRTVEDPELDHGALKSGARPQNADLDGDEMQFEDEFEDEFDSDEEIVEAGVDGRPDAEREADERDGVYIFLSWWQLANVGSFAQVQWTLIKIHLWSDEISSKMEKLWLLTFRPTRCYTLLTRPGLAFPAISYRTTLVINANPTLLHYTLSQEPKQQVGGSERTKF